MIRRHPGACALVVTSLVRHPCHVFVNHHRTRLVTSACLERLLTIDRAAAVKAGQA